jgi:hypothetical protein
MLPTRRALAASLAVAATLTFAAGVPPGRAAEDPAVAPGEKRQLATQAEIDAAVARGVKWLLSEQHGDGSFGSVTGETSLALWALRHSGAARDDASSLRAAEHLERNLPDGTSYGNGLGICALLAQDPVKHKARIEKVIAQLVKGQCDNGQWSYLCGRGGRNVGDNSNTQIALLGLGSAKRLGFDVPEATMRRSVEFVTGTQNEDGGWGYSKTQSSASYPAMTAGVLMSWFLVSGALVNVDPSKIPFKDEPEAKNALRWLRENWVLMGKGLTGKTPQGDTWPYYWLWSLERCCDAGGIDRIGLHDWYQEGSRTILDKQSEKGHWVDSRAVCDTSWALLFFRRGMRKLLDGPTITPGGTEPAAPITPSPGDAGKKPAPDPKPPGDAPPAGK